jgi:hypothetical protein
VYVNITSTTIEVKDNGKSALTFTRLDDGTVQVQKPYGGGSTVLDLSCIEEIQYALVCFLNTGEFDRDI